MKPNLLVLTPIAHIEGLNETLNRKFNCKINSFAKNLNDFEFSPYIHAIFTNPNMSQIYLNEEALKPFSSLRVIATASTGLTHMDMEYILHQQIEVISLTKDYEYISQISSTAELAFALTLEGIRNLSQANNSVRKGNWEYLPYIGRQFKDLKIGVVGLGRLGRMYANFCTAFGAEVYFFDPYVDSFANLKKVHFLSEIFEICNVVSLHVHVNSETHRIIDSKVLSVAQPEIVLINTSRGEIVDESDVIAFLRQNPNSKYLTDVLTRETFGIETNLIWRESLRSNQIFITPHMGGMTREAQQLAYFRTAQKLIDYFENS